MAGARPRQVGRKLLNNPKESHCSRWLVRPSLGAFYTIFGLLGIDEYVIYLM